MLVSGTACAEPKAEIIEKKTRYGEISYPQISGLADKQIEDSINKIILEEAATWNCDFDGEHEDVDGLDYNAWTTLRLIDEKYLSYTVGHDYFCGGAHPDQHIETYNYDLQEGHPMPINALLVPEMLDENLYNYLVKNHTFDEEGCGDAYTPDMKWDYYRTGENIVFLPRIGRSAQTCWEEFPVPLADFKDYCGLQGLYVERAAGRPG